MRFVPGGLGHCLRSRNCDAGENPVAELPTLRAGCDVSETRFGLVDIDSLPTHIRPTELNKRAIQLAHYKD